MTTVTEKRKFKRKVRPASTPEVGGELIWCKEHRVWSSFFHVWVGKDLTPILEAAKLGIPGYPCFLLTAQWDALPLEKYLMPSNESVGAHRPTKAADRDKEFLVIPAGALVYFCVSCDRMWPDEDSAEACFDQH